MDILFFILGFILLIKGADWFVEGASQIATRFGISQLVIGLTIVAMGTSLPETFVSVMAALQQNAGISIGNVVGSNILNIGIILSITSMILPLHIQKSTTRYEIPFLIFISVLLAFLGLKHTLSFIDGILFWILFLLYLYYIFKISKSNTENASKQKISLSKSIFFIPLGLVCLILGSQLAVTSATNIAIMLKISQRFIGLTIVALGTSLPELLTSLLAAKKKNADIAIGNIVGSNIFNILFVLGTSSLITPIPFETKFLIDTLFMIGIGLLLWMCTKRKNELNRKSGFLLLIFYVIYFIFLLQK